MSMRSPWDLVTPFSSMTLLPNLGTTKQDCQPETAISDLDAMWNCLRGELTFELSSLQMRLSFWQVWEEAILWFNRLDQCCWKAWESWILCGQDVDVAQAFNSHLGGLGIDMLSSWEFLLYSSACATLLSQYQPASSTQNNNATWTCQGSKEKSTLQVWFPAHRSLEFVACRLRTSNESMLLMWQVLQKA